MEVARTPGVMHLVLGFGGIERTASEALVMNLMLNLSHLRHKG